MQVKFIVVRVSSQKKRNVMSQTINQPAVRVNILAEYTGLNAMDAWLKKAKQQEKQKYIIVVNLNNSKNDR